jgi:hypothetical protein
MKINVQWKHALRDERMWKKNPIMKLFMLIFDKQNANESLIHYRSSQ